MTTGHTKRFIPIQTGQIRKVWGIAGKKGMSKDELNEIIEEITGYPSLSSMSSFEAECLIKRLLSPGNRKIWPKRPPYPDQIMGKADHLPHWYHVRDLRSMAREYFETPQAFRQWLKKYRKVDSIRQLDKQNAIGTYTALKAMTAKKRKGPEA